MDSPHVSSKAEAPGAKNRIRATNTRTAWRSLWLGAAFAICLATPAKADTVSGRVYGADAKPMVNTTLTARPAQGDGVEFKTDGGGNFSVYLDPGRYTVTTIKGGDGEAVIDSYPQPVQQDIHLKKKGK